jgi:isoquinoline 1-oxidoreductase beta subunit
MKKKTTPCKAKIVNESRRAFLKSGLATSAGLTLGIYFPVVAARPLQTGTGETGDQVVTQAAFELNAFVHIGTDESVTVIVKHLEMGQGTYTGLPTLLAEELDAAWSQVRVQAAPADATRYNNLFWGPTKGAGGSTAIANSYEQMRKAGAVAREMMVQAAAEKWGAVAADITVREGMLRHPQTNREPTEVFTKDPHEFRLIGTVVPRKDSVDKVNGSAIYTQDVKLRGLLTALVAHPPRFGAKLKQFNAGATKKIDGVVDAVAIPNGVAVLAKDFWSAKQGRDLLQVDWDESNAFALGSEDIMSRYKRLAQNPGRMARKVGDLESAMSRSTRVVEATFEFPYLAHAAMEPMNCVIELNQQGCEIWNGEQFQTPDQMAVASVLGLRPEQVKINMLYAGGSFGRRANPQSDYVVEAAHIVKTIGDRAPVKLVWTREDDMRAGYYRPMYFHQLKAGVDAEGNPIAWQHRIVRQSILKGTSFEQAMAKDGIDPTSVEGAANLPYALPNITVDLHSPDIDIPVQWWRSVGSTHTAFAVETFIDELATTVGDDPLEFRRELLREHPRHLGVLELAAHKAGSGQPLTNNRGRGIAVHKSFNSYVAQVAEVTVAGDGTFSVDRVVIAVDCGIAVNPDVIQAQMEGGMGFGLSAALSGEITLNKGRVEQSNFHDYTVLRINQMQKVEVHIVKSTAAPTGVGEPATPVIAPAVANALHAATGQRFYGLPLRVRS